MIKFTFLSENKTYGSCNAEFGLSIFIETDEKKILFDTGASYMFADNAKHCHVDLTSVEAAVISHGHYDHTNGVPEFARINKTAPIYIHKDAFGHFYGMTDGEIDDYECGILWTFAEKQALEGRLKYTDGPLWLTKNIVISGTIPSLPGTVPTEHFFNKNARGVMVPDPMNHEQFLAIRNGDQGVFLFSGCSHKGIIPAIVYCKTLFPGEKIAGIIAGMHLYSASDDMRKMVVDKVVAENPDMVMPVHCTGMEAICMLKEKLGDRCVIASAGDHYEYL